MVDFLMFLIELYKLIHNFNYDHYRISLPFIIDYYMP